MTNQTRWVIFFTLCLCRTHKDCTTFATANLTICFRDVGLYFMYIILYPILVALLLIYPVFYHITTMCAIYLPFLNKIK